MFTQLLEGIPLTKHVNTYLSLFGGRSSAVMGKKSSCLSIRIQTKSVQTLLHSISVCGSFVCGCMGVWVYGGRGSMTPHCKRRQGEHVWHQGRHRVNCIQAPTTYSTTKSEAIHSDLAAETTLSFSLLLWALQVHKVGPKQCSRVTKVYIREVVTCGRSKLGPNTVARLRDGILFVSECVCTSFRKRLQGENVLELSKYFPPTFPHTTREDSFLAPLPSSVFPSSSAFTTTTCNPSFIDQLSPSPSLV